MMNLILKHSSAHFSNNSFVNSIRKAIENKGFSQLKQLQLLTLGAFCTCVFFSSFASAQHAVISARKQIPAVNLKGDVDTAGSYAEIQQRNLQRAAELFQRLYSPYFELKEVGVQLGYYENSPKSGLVRYGRTWATDNGVALSLAVAKQEPSAEHRAFWLMKNAHYIIDPDQPEKKMVAGWPFSMNQRRFGDNWKDRRFITSTNAEVMIGLAKYMTSKLYNGLEYEQQQQFSNFFGEALRGILYHIETDGPNAGLVTAGWTLNVLEDAAEINLSYDEILDKVGYGADKISEYSKKVEIIRSRNVFTRDCNMLLKLLNVTLNHYDELFSFDNAPYTRGELDLIRLKLQVGIFDKLFNPQDKRMISGRSADGIQTDFSCIDNAPWLVLSAKLSELNSEQIKMISSSLFSIIQDLTKTFELNDANYFGVCFFPENYSDIYVGNSTPLSDAYSIEATCSLICGLLEFVQAYPKDANAEYYRRIAVNLWKYMQYFINDLDLFMLLL